VTAQAHAKLQTSEPQAGSTLASAPKELRLKFNEGLEPAFSKIKLTNDKNAEITLQHAEVDKADPSMMAAAVPALRSGTYHVQWTTMTRDGHKTKGDFTFKIK
jgi:methionine-rich copper-binding protein CopC